jgi:exo-1,4-beta-D-glucosaminidase
MKGDSLNWKKSKWYYTPQAAYADYSALQKLPKTKLSVTHTNQAKGDSTTSTVSITNTGKAVAFFVHLRALKDKDGDDILPVIFSDNYISLAPGESRTIECTYANKDAQSASPYLQASAWNIDIAKSTIGNNAGFDEGLPGK